MTINVDSSSAFTSGPSLSLWFPNSAEIFHSHSTSFAVKLHQTVNPQWRGMYPHLPTLAQGLVQVNTQNDVPGEDMWAALGI